MADSEFPVTIRDDTHFGALVQAWEYGGVWEDYSFVYEGKLDVPSRLHGFTIIASNDPTQRFGALLQVSPSQAQTDGAGKYLGRKLLAKVRLN